MIYTFDHLKVVYKAGQKGLKFAEVVEVLGLLEDSGTSAQGSTRGRPKGTTQSAPAEKVARKQRGRKNTLTQRVMEQLIKAGKAGVHVSDIAAAIGTKPVNVTAWVYSTGQKLIKSKELSRIAPATYAYVPKN